MFYVGNRQYEFSNHLGNVLTTVSDKVTYEDGYYMANVTSANDYYPFGWTMPNRKLASEGYRYGFNGMEKDDELKGEGNSYDFGARLYDSRVGRWLATDPLEAKYPFVSSYNYTLNNPIRLIDPDGMQVEDANGKVLDENKQTNDLGKLKAGIDARKNTLTTLNQTLTTQLGNLKSKKRPNQSKIKSLENQIANNKDQINELDKGLKSIKEMVAADIVFVLNPVKSGNNKMYLQNGKVYLDYKSQTMLGHEVIHGGQLIRGTYSFGSQGNGGLLYDLEDEVEAYKFQASLDPSSFRDRSQRGVTKNISDIDGAYVKTQHPTLYRGLAEKQLTITSTYADFRAEYPSYGLSTSPALQQTPYTEIHRIRTDTYYFKEKNSKGKLLNPKSKIK